MDPKESYSLKLISNPVISPKGTFFVLNWIDFLSNDYRSSIYLKTEKEVIRLTWGGKESQPYFYDGRLLYVKGGQEDSLMRSSLGEPEKVFSFHKIKKFLPYHGGFVFLGEENQDKDKPFEATSRKYRFDSRGLLRSRTSLYYFNGQEIRRVMGGNFDVTDFDTDGKRVVASATLTGDDVSLQDVFEVDINSSSFQRLTKGEGAVYSLALTKEGFAYLGHRKGLSPWARKDIIFEDGRSVTCGKTCGNSVVNDLFVKYGEKIEADGDKVISLGHEGGFVNVYSIGDSKAEKITEVEGVVLDFDYKDNKLEYVFSNPEKPSLMGNYDPNENVHGVVPRYEVNGIEGWIIERDPSSPNVVFVHGGPHTAYGYMYYIEFNFLYSEGFNVIYTNPSGSQGYGEEFAKAIVGSWCDIDFKEITNFLKSLKLKGKFHLTGGSYGGYFTNMAITKTDFFASGIAERSISNLVSMCGTSDIGFWFNAVEAGISDPWNKESIEKLLEMSPIYHVEKVKTPLMLIHGEEDFRCPIEQAEQYFIALKSKGIEVKLIRYPGDSHEHARRGKPLNMTDRLSRKAEWLKSH
jgi:dipeptidyl aminopeptidase/acylaminoacyl peptidase